MRAGQHVGALGMTELKFVYCNTWIGKYSRAIRHGTTHAAAPRTDSGLTKVAVGAIVQITLTV